MNNSAIRNSRLNKELTDLDRDPPPGISCYPKEDDLTDLEAYIKGPPDSPYEQGLFKLDVQIPTGYPFEPPQIRFVTSIYHPNIDDAGRICADILKKGEKGSWKPALNLSTTLILLSQLLAHPNPDDPLDAEIAKEYQLDYPTFRHKAMEYTKKYASEEALSNEVKPEEKHVDNTNESIEKNQPEQEEYSRCPKLSLSLAKKSNAVSSQSLLPSSLGTKPKSAVKIKLSTRKIEKHVLDNIDNSQIVPDFDALKAIDHGKEPVNETRDSIFNKDKNVVMSEEENLVVKIKKNIDMDKNETVKTQLRKSTVKKGKASHSVTETVDKRDSSLSEIETKPAVTNNTSSQSIVNIAQTELVFPEPSTVNTQQDTQTFKRKIIVLDETPDVIDISDDDNEDDELIHTLQLSKKLKRNKISLSKQKR